MVDRKKLAEEATKAFVKKVNDSAELIEGWTKALQFVFTDPPNTGYWFRVELDGHVKNIENVIKSKEDYDVCLIFKDPESLQGLLDKTVSPQAAMFEGKLKFDKGGTAELLKLSVAFA
jgi:putative sterol carrier protein